MKKKRKIGRIDVADFPILNRYNIPIKIDTGAYTSSMHCPKIECIKDRLYCTFNDSDTPFVFDTYSLKIVKSSNGHIQLRYAITTEIKLFNTLFPIQLTLTNRQPMRYPVLIGRKFLGPRFIVDTQKTNLSQQFLIKHN